ncbi:MAG TPA: hypothetical protein VH044_14995 [Polyangiaceae bacterium]|nr:hypothetical protein [Polyangiaceae bacterium]
MQFDARQRLPLAASALACVMAVSAPAWADRTARLDYVRAPGAESCSDEQTLRDQVAKRIGYDPFADAASETIAVRIEPLALPPQTFFVAHVSSLDDEGTPQGVRDLRTSGACSDLIDAVALAIGLAIGPHGPAPPPPSAPAAPPSTPSPPGAASPPATEPPEPNLPPSPFAPRVLGIDASAGGAASVGTAPRPTFGATVSVGFHGPSFAIDVEGRLETAASASAPGGGSVSSSLWVGSLVSCWTPGPWLLCGVAQVGRLHADGETSGAHDLAAIWVAAGARFGVQIPLGSRFAVRVRNDLVADLDRPTLVLHGLDAWRAPALADSLGTDLVVRFP